MTTPKSLLVLVVGLAIPMSAFATETFSNDANDFFQVDVTPNPNGDQQFFGVINTAMAFTTVTSTQTIAGEFYGVDEVYYGTVGATPVALATWGSIKSVFTD